MLSDLKKIIHELEQKKQSRIVHKNAACISMPAQSIWADQGSTFFKMGDFFAVHHLTLNYYEILSKHLYLEIQRHQDKSKEDPENIALQELLHQINQKIERLHNSQSAVAQSRVFLPVFVKGPSFDPVPLIPSYQYVSSLHPENTFHELKLKPEDVQCLQDAIFAAPTPEQCLSNLASIFGKNKSVVAMYSYNTRYRGYILFFDNKDKDLEKLIIKLSKKYKHAFNNQNEENLWIIDEKADSQISRDLADIFEIFINFSTLGISTTHKNIRLNRKIEIPTLLTSEEHIYLFDKFSQPVSIKKKVINKLLKREQHEPVSGLNIIVQHGAVPVKKTTHTLSKRLLIYFNTEGGKEYLAYLDTESQKVIFTLDLFHPNAELLKKLYLNTLDILKLDNNIILRRKKGE